MPCCYKNVVVKVHFGFANGTDYSPMTTVGLFRFNANGTARYHSVAVITLMAVGLAVVGAFGSYVAMGLPLRLLHFLGTSLAISILAFGLSASLRRYVLGGAFPFWASLIVALAIAPLGGLIVQQSLRLFAPQALPYVSLSELTGQVLLINFFVAVVAWMAFRQSDDSVASPSKDVRHAQTDDISSELRARLPITLRQAAIVALSAEEHYVRVRTDRGQALILMKLSSAITALGPEVGVRIHRSHWVSRSLAASVDTRTSREGIRIDKDTVLPVSRAGRKLLCQLHNRPL